MRIQIHKRRRHYHVSVHETTAFLAVPPVDAPNGPPDDAAAHQARNLTLVITVLRDAPASRRIIVATPPIFPFDRQYIEIVIAAGNDRI